jgi:alpha-amylase/alpha-mannosidase (GH57 family)
MTRVAILWHMHQPFYEDLVTREHIMPWVRLHALKDYFGMVRLVEEFPAVRMTFNLVPSLLVQLEAFAANRAHDRYLEVGLKPAAELSPDDVSFMLANFFHAQRQRMIDVYPRYAELLARRGDSPPPPGGSARSFTVEELRDLQVWQKLAWMDPIYLESDPRVRRLVEKGRGFSEDDKTLLREAELDLLNAVIPAYRAAAARGQIELSTSPFYHPILPLLCDTSVYLRTHPESKMPRRRFVHPEDAADQLARACSHHQRLFGARPIGLWPSEGSVSDAMVPLVAAAGFSWMATDEQILAHTLGLDFTRDAAGHLEQADRLYQPYIVRAGGREVTTLFRDHALSDLIGFTYAGWGAEAAADDFVGRLAAAGRRYAERGGKGEAVIPIILDGENAWEHFEGGGRPFLRALYTRLSGHPELRTVTMAEAAGPATAALDGIFPGSWIDANFYIWIGHADDHRAWGQLTDAREALDQAGAAEAHAVMRAREEVLIAEGSDWFWWYGDDHSSEHDHVFDDLFRRHLRNVYGLLGRPVPDELFFSNITAGAQPATASPPTGLLAPVLDGEETSYFEWLGAGLLEVRDVAGAMHQTERRGSLLGAIHFGFDRERLFVRLDARQRAAELIANGYCFCLKFLDPDGVRVLIRQRGGQAAATVMTRAAGGAWQEQREPEARVVAGAIVELAVPLRGLFAAATALSAAPASSSTPLMPLTPLTPAPGGSPLAFFIEVLDPQGREVERHPLQRPIESERPDERFEALNWTA